jgi:hypothetical protein
LRGGKFVSPNQTTKTANMKKHLFALILIVCTSLFYSCKSGGSKAKAFETPDGVADVVSNLNKAFGKDASYTDVTISFLKGIGTTISATGTKDPSSGKLISKMKGDGAWRDVSEITLEIEGDAKPADFMFRLNDVDDLKKIPGMVKMSIDKIKKEKNFDVVAQHVSVKSPSKINSPEDKLVYNVNLAPENGGTSFITVFDNNGNFQRMIY